MGLVKGSEDGESSSREVAKELPHVKSDVKDFASTKVFPKRKPEGEGIDLLERTRYAKETEDLRL